MKKIENCKLKIVNLAGGFTLVELILYMGLVSTILIVLSNIFITSIEAQLESQSSSILMQDEKYIVTRLAYDIFRSSSINIPAAIGNQGDILQLTIGGQTYQYSLNNGNLELTANSITENLNSYDTTVSSVNFQRIGNSGGDNTIKLTLNLTSKTQRLQGAENKIIQTTFGLRNN